MNDRESLITKVMDTGGRLRVRSALNPVLWLCAIVTIPCVMAYGWASDKPVWLLVLAFAPVIVALAGFVFLLFVDRDKLQSEEYQIRKQSLELIQQKGDPTAIEAVLAALILKPLDSEAPRIEGGDTELRSLISCCTVIGLAPANR